MSLLNYLLHVNAFNNLITTSLGHLIFYSIPTDHLMTLQRINEVFQ